MAEMTAADAAEIIQLFDRHGLGFYVDGGWAVDAVLGEHTRPHDDLDIALEHQDVPRLRALLAAHGFTDVPRDDTRACNFVLGDDRGRQVDVHSYTFDAAGRCVFGVPYPLESLHGAGVIAGQAVQCIAPEWLVKFHTGYPLDGNDYHDVRLLCRRFGFPLPEEYAAFAAGELPGRDVP